MKANQGFSLFDLLISMAIISMTLTFGAPALKQVFAKSETSHAKQITRRMLAMARQTAINEGIRVKVCGINNEKSCTRSSFTTLAIFIDENKNHKVDQEEKVIRYQDIDYSGKTKLSASLARKYIQFNPRGSASQAGSFIFCDSRYPNYASRVTVSMAGRSYVGLDLDNDGLVETASGDPIRCYD